MTLFTTVLAVVAVTLLSGHVAPSVDDNNRYLKVTPFANGFRLAYTVFFGEIPGASERRKLDANRDGRIDRAEADAFGHLLAAEVRDALDLETSGTTEPLRWTIVDVGLGTDAVAAGAFSVDMIAYVCTAGSPNRLHLRDRVRIPRPGETEVKVEDTPGVTVHVARVGPADDPSHDYRFVGPGGPLSDDGLRVEWTATADAPRVPGNPCTAPSTGGGPARSWLWAAVGGGVAVALAGAVLLSRRGARAA